MGVSLETEKFKQSSYFFFCKTSGSKEIYTSIVYKM